MATRDPGVASLPVSAGPAARVRGLSRAFGGRVVLDGVDLDIAPGEFVAMLGVSGTGKSTLLRALAGLDREVTGELSVPGPVAVAFQEPRLLPWRRVLANVALGLRVPDAGAVAGRALEEVGLTERAGAWPLTLSGGEAQRAALARALVREPSLLLLDEPFSALDALTRIAMHRLVLRLWERHRPAVLLVTHDVDEALILADRVLVLASGRIVFSGPVEVPRPRDRDHPGLTALRRQYGRTIMIRTNRVLALAAAASLAVLTACSSSSSSSAAGKGAGEVGGATASSSGTSSANQASVSGVTLHIGDQAGTGAQALLTAAGLIDKLPFEVAWSDFTSGPPMLQAMGAGSVDVGGVGNAPPVFAAAGGSKIAIVGAYQANPLGSALLVPKGSPITSVAQLKGKRIAVAQGSSADYHLLTVLTKAGLSVHDVTITYLQPAEGLAALTSGHVDAWDIWSPFIEQAEVQKNARALVTGTGYGSPYSFAVASRAALADPARAAAISDYLKLVAQAHAWATRHQAAWADVWAKASGLPDDVMVKAANDSAADAVPITPAVIASEQQVSDAFTKAGLISVHVNFNQYVVTSFNNTASVAS